MTELSVEQFAGGVTLYSGDCLAVLPTLAENSIDSCVTDPPYGIGFMSKRWDHGVPGIDYWHEVYRVLKPGAHLLAFGGTRTYHRMACAIEDAGFEIRDTILYLYGSGFPKSHDVSKGIDRAAPRVGMFAMFAAHYAERRATSGLTHNAICEKGCFYAEHNHGGASSNWENGFNVPTLSQWAILQPLLGLSLEWLPLIERVEAERNIIGRGKACFSAETAWSKSLASDYDITAPATTAARQWEGWGTALKPACEPIVLARKPMSEKTVAANVLRWGTGAINVDGCRVPIWETITNHARSGETDVLFGANKQQETYQSAGQSLGRWPANLIHDGSEEVLAGFPDADGGSASEYDWTPSSNQETTTKVLKTTINSGVHFGDSGSAARFFYTAKADSDDRLGSKHPTVKPLDLMQYLVRLVTPKGGIVLDPFAGTGTTAEAAWREGMRAVLIEREAEYQADIRRRMALLLSGPDERGREAIKARMKDKPMDAGPLFKGMNA